ncbi:protein MpTrihelix39 [Marchantia polymorpha subsp. ruderalis]
MVDMHATSSGSSSSSSSEFSQHIKVEELQPVPEIHQNNEMKPPSEISCHNLLPTLPLATGTFREEVSHVNPDHGFKVEQPESEQRSATALSQQTPSGTPALDTRDNQGQQAQKRRGKRGRAPPKAKAESTRKGGTPGDKSDGPHEKVVKRTRNTKTVRDETLALIKIRVLLHDRCRGLDSQHLWKELERRMDQLGYQKSASDWFRRFSTIVVSYKKLQQQGPLPKTKRKPYWFSPLESACASLLAERARKTAVKDPSRSNEEPEVRSSSAIVVREPTHTNSNRASCPSHQANDRNETKSGLSTGTEIQSQKLAENVMEDCGHERTVLDSEGGKEENDSAMEDCGHKRTVLDSEGGKEENDSAMEDCGLKRTVLDSEGGKEENDSAMEDCGHKRTVLDSEGGKEENDSAMEDCGLKRTVLDSEGGKEENDSAMEDCGHKRTVLDSEGGKEENGSAILAFIDRCKVQQSNGSETKRTRDRKESSQMMLGIQRAMKFLRERQNSLQLKEAAKRKAMTKAFLARLANQEATAHMSQELDVKELKALETLASFLDSSARKFILMQDEREREFAEALALLEQEESLEKEQLAFVTQQIEARARQLDELDAILQKDLRGPPP